jgi:glycolate oxidase
MSEPGRPEYNPITPEIVAELAAIVGEKYVLTGDADALAPFSHDEVPGLQYARMPEAVVRPRTTQEIAAILRLANERNFPVTPRGAGSGLSGGAVPACGGVVLLCDRMSAILEIDPDNMTVTVEPGVVTNDINARLAEHGLFYAGYPMSLETCFIGGNVAENAGGGKAIKYGVTGRYVIGLEVVTPTGDVLNLGGKLLKNVTGYDLISLLVGSEGTLGVFTKIILRLLPLPKASVDLLALFNSAEEAIAAVPKLMTESGLIPTAVEFMDRSAIRAACEYLNETLPWRQAGAMLLITVDGADEKRVTAEYDTLGEQCEACGATEVFVADNFTTSERVWKVRRNISEALSTQSKLQTNEDLVVPPAAIPQLVADMERIGQKHGVTIPCFGHAGDGNLHIRATAPADWTEQQWREAMPALLRDIHEATIRLGGQLSGEHGIGHKRKAYMKKFLSPETLAAMAAIKRAWDPNNILNPGKIFDIS